MGCCVSYGRTNVDGVEGWLLYLGAVLNCDVPILEAIYFTCPNALFARGFARELVKREGLPWSNTVYCSRGADDSFCAQFRKGDTRLTIGIAPLVEPTLRIPSWYYQEVNTVLTPPTRCFYAVQTGRMLGVWNNQASYSYGPLVYTPLRSPVECFRILERLHK